jgi:hypothetical protein
VLVEEDVRLGDTPRQRKTLHAVLEERVLLAARSLVYDDGRGVPLPRTRAQLTEEQVVAMNQRGLKQLGARLKNTTFGGPRVG